jgi:hypothetical protein
MGEVMSDRLAVIRTRAADLGYVFRPTLAEVEIRGFETRHGIELPDGYRRFLQEIGNGGEGPGIDGLAPLGAVPSELPPSWEREWRDLPNIRKPFPLTDAWVWEGEDHDDERLASSRHGTLALCNSGCGMYWLLVVTGAERGQVWAHTDVGVCPQDPRRDFLDWIEAWLNGIWWWK